MGWLGFGELLFLREQIEHTIEGSQVVLNIGRAGDERFERAQQC